jgi:hypothetical protein
LWAAAVLHWLFWWRPPALLRRVIVNFTSDPTEAIEGVLWSYRGGWLTLKECAALKAGQPPAKMMPSDAVVHRDQIKFLQVAP